MPLTNITPLPALSRTDPNFKQDVDTFFGTQLPTFTTDINSLATGLEGIQSNVINLEQQTQGHADNAALHDANSLANAQTAGGFANIAEAALASTTVPVFSSGQTVSAGDMRYSPISFETYRAITAGVRTIDPSLDSANWYLLGQAQAQNAALLWAFALSN